MLCYTRFIEEINHFLSPFELPIVTQYTPAIYKSHFGSNSMSRIVTAAHRYCNVLVILGALTYTNVPSSHTED